MPLRMKKPQAVALLADTVKERVPRLDASPPDKKKKKKNTGMSSFPATARWKPLKPLQTAVPEPHNPRFKKPRGPTDLDDCVPVKHNFGKRFNVPEFTGTDVTCKRCCWGNFKEVNGERVEVRTPRTKGKANKLCKKKWHTANPGSLQTHFFQ